MARSSITLAKLCRGAEKSTRVSENYLAIEDFTRRRKPRRWANPTTGSQPCPKSR